MALQGEFGVNHYSNELAGGPSEGEDEGGGGGVRDSALLSVRR